MRHRRRPSRLLARAGSRRRGARFLAVFIVHALAATGTSRPAHSQDGGSSRLGIAHIGALGVHVGSAAIERATNAREAGVIIDFGWLRTPRLRIQGEMDLLRATLTERVETEDSTFRGSILDLTTSIAAVLLLRNGTQRIVPYVTAGAGVHALSSALGTLVLDQRYNANPFGVHAAAGLRIGLARRSGIDLEVRAVAAENVNRSAVRLGGIVYFGDLARFGNGRHPANRAK